MPKAEEEDERGMERGIVCRICDVDRSGTSVVRCLTASQKEEEIRAWTVWKVREDVEALVAGRGLAWTCTRRRMDGT